MSILNDILKENLVSPVFDISKMRQTSKKLAMLVKGDF